MRGSHCGIPKMFAAAVFDCYIVVGIFAAHVCCPSLFPLGVSGGAWFGGYSVIFPLIAVPTQQAGAASCAYGFIYPFMSMISDTS